LNGENYGEDGGKNQQQQKSREKRKSLKQKTNLMDRLNFILFVLWLFVCHSRLRTQKDFGRSNLSLFDVTRPPHTHMPRLIPFLPSKRGRVRLTWRVCAGYRAVMAAQVKELHFLIDEAKISRIGNFTDLLFIKKICQKKTFDRIGF
jgi:hypothetical protein